MAAWGISALESEEGGAWIHESLAPAARRIEHVLSAPYHVSNSVEIRAACCLLEAIGFTLMYPVTSVLVAGHDVPLARHLRMAVARLTDLISDTVDPQVSDPEIYLSELRRQRDALARRTETHLPPYPGTRTRVDSS